MRFRRAGVTTGWGRTGLALAAASVLALAACADPAGDANPGAPEPTEAVGSNTEFQEGASPAAIASPATTDRPESVTVLEAAISDGRIDPDPLEVQTGQSYVLRITGDGTAHTLAIDPLVSEREIAAEGVTEIDVSVSGEPADLEITLDGAPAGILRVTTATGLSE